MNLKQFPFIRLLVALIAGIMFQWYFKITLSGIMVLVCSILLGLTFFSVLSFTKKFVFNWVRGLLLLLLFVCTGMAITWKKNITNDSKWFGRNYIPGSPLIATIGEPLIEKSNSWKGMATITAIYQNNKWQTACGNVLVYFKKDTVTPLLQYGDELIFNTPVQPVKNSGNPAAFDYKKYCLFQNITGQVYLRQNDYAVLSEKNANAFRRFLFVLRDWTLHQLKQNIHIPEQLGIAEALLIGYRNDLDKDLVQAYSNTGTVHIIAISGLHLGIIYAALVMFFSLFKQGKVIRIIQPVFILLVIWLFTGIAGAAPSVLRAAVMFTCILAGKMLNRNGNIYNTLAASAFILLVTNPFYLWDAGFQLSYTAVLGIVIFYKLVNNLLYFKNRTLRWVWQLSAISLSAQIFTLPLVVYHFHQLPVMFLFSNLVAVPLSGIILFEELLLFCFSMWPAAASLLGFVTELSIKAMNDFIKHINKLPFAVWNGWHISVIQLLFMLAGTCFFAAWIFSKNTQNVITALCSTLAFFIIRDVDIIHHQHQQKLLVYNIAKHRAIDFIDGTGCRFSGDSVVLTDVLQRNFNLRPARIKDRVYSSGYAMLPCINNYVLAVGSAKILLLNKPLFTSKPANKIALDLLILTANTNYDPLSISNIFQCNTIVADATIPEWKAIKLKKEFEQLHLRFYSVAQQGAFTLKL